VMTVSMMAHTPEPNSFLMMFHTMNLGLPILDPYRTLCAQGPVM
jgi:regulation of enolase protein 1 (concanavalin A-like superfamily)